MEKLYKTKLNTRSYYNFLESTLSIDDIINHSINNHLQHACLLDDNMHGVIEFYNKCLSNNLTPIIGLNVKNYLDHQIYVIAKNYNGYKTLCKLTSFESLQKDISSIALNKDDVAVILKEYDDAFKDTDYYVINDIEHQKAIAFMSANHKEKIDTKYLKVIDAIKNEEIISEFEIINLTETKDYLDNDDYKFNQTQLSNLEKLLDSVQLVIPKTEVHFIDYPIPSDKDKNTYFWDILDSKLKSINKYNETYLSRLKFEYDLIVSKGFVDYFLVVSDFINYANNNQILIGPGRGSAPGSLVAYLLNITKLDPIENNLLFERFLNEARYTMPDIDIDIMDTKREKLIQYLINKYGEENVTYIITFSRYKLKMAIRDVGRILGIPISVVDKISKKITPEIENNVDELIINNPALSEIYLENKLLFDLAQRLIGMPRQYSIHAAGIILSDKPIYEIAPIVKNSDNKIIVQYSMEYLEELGLIKIDLLGLRNLTTIKQIVDLIKATRKVDIDLNKIDLNVQEVYSLLSKAETNGIFQFESPGMRKLLRDIQPKCLEDLSITSAIFRPGASSHIKEFVNNKKNNKIEYLHEDLSEILNPTYGAIIYQEQIINIVQKFAKFDATESDKFRKAISKKVESVILELKDKFIKNSIANGYDKKVSEKIFNFMYEFASYGFNHSHSLSYALISYQLAYLKQHFPLETITILLSNVAEKSKLKQYKEEALKYNIEFKCPDINMSSNGFVLMQNSIYFAFNSILGIANETTKKILSLRSQEENQQFKDPIRTISMLNANGVSKKNIENMIKVGVFDSLEPNRCFLLANLEEMFKKNANIYTEDNKPLFDLNLNYDVVNDEHLYPIWEEELLGFSVTESMYDKKFNEVVKTHKISNTISDKYRTTILIQVNKYSKKLTTNNNVMHLVDAIVNNKPINIYSFDEDFQIDNGFYVVVVKPFKNSTSNNFVIEKIVEKV